jgi:excisionase family DNA binding protein
MTAATSKNTPHPGRGSRYGPTPATPHDGAQRQPPAPETRKETDQWTATGGPDQPTIPPPTPAGPPVQPAATTAAALARLPEVLTVREAAAILRVGRNQLYQAVARGQLRAIRIGRSIRIPTQTLLDLLDHDRPPTAGGDE